MYGSNFCSENIGGKFLEMDRKRLAAVMDLEKLIGRAYGILLRVYGVGGQLLEGIKSFYENASASV